MVSAVFIIAIGLGAAFLLGLFREGQTTLAYQVMLFALGAMALISASWLWAIGFNGAAVVDIFTAGTSPPFAISLRVGLPEAVLLTLVNLVGVGAALSMRETLIEKGRGAMSILLIAIMALAGIIMTRDIFNLFVFFELMAISTAGMVLMSKDPRALGAGFKYLVIGQLISTLFLIGIIYTYHTTGSLNLDYIDGSKLALTPAVLWRFSS